MRSPAQVQPSPTVNNGCSDVTPMRGVSPVSFSSVNHNTPGTVRDIDAVTGNRPDTPFSSSRATTRSPSRKVSIATLPLGVTLHQKGRAKPIVITPNTPASRPDMSGEKTLVCCASSVAAFNQHHDAELFGGRGEWCHCGD